MNLTRPIGRFINRILGWLGLRLSRAQNPEDLDPISRLLARGQLPGAQNSRESMDAFYADPELMTKYFDRGRLAFYAQVADRITQLGVQPADVLDVGCGSGHLLAELARAFPAARLHGVDFSAESIRLARKLNPSMSFEEMDVFDLGRIGRQFDLVLCTEVLEHLEHADRALENLLAVCRPGGALAITVPQGRRDSYAGHVNFWTPESFRREFRGLEPRVEEIDTYLFVVIRRPAASCAR